MAEQRSGRTQVTQMNDTKELLQRARSQFPPPQGVMESLLRRRDRKRRNQRVAAGVVGIAVFLAAVWLVTSGVALDRSQKQPGGPGPSETGPSITGPAEHNEFSGLGFIGLPPEGATPSTPARGALVLRFMFLQGTGDAGRFGGGVYEDGRLIWWRLGPPENPDGTTQRGHLERRLTPEDVELLRAELLSIGLFDHDRNLVGPVVPHSGELEVPSGDRLVRVTWGDCCGRVQADVASVTPTPAQVSALGRLEEHLNALAWQDGEKEAYVASRYALCLETEQDVGTDRLFASLPSQAESLVRSWDLTYRTHADPTLPYYSRCSSVTIGQARALARTLEEVGISQGAFGDEVTYDVLSRHPDRTDVMVAFYPLLPHEM